MFLVVADTSPIRYLVKIGHIGLLPQLFERVFIPSLVYGELHHPSAPASVQPWASSLPAWVEDVGAPLRQLTDRLHTVSPP
jgi:predicted nucleic acid-binding protein